MKIHYPCPRCNANNFGATTRYIIDIYENNIIDHECGCQNISISILVNQKYDLLFESGVRATKDGYYREGISSIAVSLERFYELGLKIICNIQSLDDDVIEKIWKFISKQSERQLGAFILSYSIALKKQPRLLNQKLVEFRNNVIHKGYFPKKEETFKFIEEVENIIMSNITELKTHFPIEYEKVINLDILKSRELAQDMIISNIKKYPHINNIINHIPSKLRLNTYLAQSEINSVVTYIEKFNNFNDIIFQP